MCHADVRGAGEICRNCSVSSCLARGSFQTGGPRLGSSLDLMEPARLRLLHIARLAVRYQENEVAGPWHVTESAGHRS